MRLVAALVAGIAALAVAAPAGAATPTATANNCHDAERQTFPPPPARVRMGPLTFRPGWDGYAAWPGMESFRRPDGTHYAKSPMYARPRSVATLYIAPRWRDAAEIVYGRVRGDAIRIRGCRRRTAFFSGGLLVRGPTCVEVRVRQRGSRRVHRRMASINMGDACPAVPATSR